MSQTSTDRTKSAYTDLLNPGEIKTVIFAGRCKMGLHFLKFLFPLCLLVFTACASSGNYKILSFFFDGVENKSEIKNQPADSLKAESALQQSAQGLKTASGPGYFYHAVYQERACGSCHDSENGYKLLEPVPDLCYECHENFSDKYSYLHAPVEAGECTTCHHPHFSRNDHLLVRTGQDLCFSCHASEDILGSETHSEIGETVCTECHNAHGGEDETLFN